MYPIIYVMFLVIIPFIHTYRTRFIPEELAKASQVFLRDAHVFPKLLSYEEYYRL
jgi:hypothetical protein